MNNVNFKTFPMHNLHGFVNQFLNNDFAKCQGADEHFMTDKFGTYPPVNISETDKNYMLEVAVPGLQKSDFSIQLDKNLLSISYAKKVEPIVENAEETPANETKEKTEKIIRSEFNFQKEFKRTFKISNHVDTNSIEAKYDNGILHITLAKKEEAKVEPKSIEIL